MSRALLVVAVTALALGAAGCGERASVTVYKQGKYQGKPDSLPWANDTFKSDKVAWERAIRARNGGQNEYNRVAPTAR
jgi:hypothetical protein